MQKLWVAFGQGSHLRWIPIHNIVATIGPEKTKGILFFHAFSGCQSCLICKHGKCDEVLDVFIQLSKYPLFLDDKALETLEKFVVIMYDRSSSTRGVNDARLELFACKQRSFDSLPPTQAALLQHAKTGCISGRCDLEPVNSFTA